MRLKITFGALALLVVMTASFATAQEPEGKKLFLDQKCNTCHTVKSQDIEATRGNDETPDLSNAAELIPSKEWAVKFVMREEEKDGKKHRRPWRGEAADLEKIVDWLMTLKSS